jgi:hypothetical protein
MGHYLIARRPAADRASYGCDHSGGLHTERHGRARANIPAAGPDDVIPVGYARRFDVDQDLVLGEGHTERHGRACANIPVAQDIDDLDIASSVSYSGYDHCSPPDWVAAA